MPTVTLHPPPSFSLSHHSLFSLYTLHPLLHFPTSLFFHYKPQAYSVFIYHTFTCLNNPTLFSFYQTSPSFFFTHHSFSLYQTPPSSPFTKPYPLLSLRNPTLFSLYPPHPPVPITPSSLFSYHTIYFLCPPSFSCPFIHPYPLFYLYLGSSSPF